MNCSIEAEAECVARHTVTLCKSLFQDLQQSQKNSVLVEHVQPVSNIMTDIYTFFKQASDIDTSVIDMLSGTPMIIIQDLPGLIEPNQLAYDMLKDQQIIPYLHKLPSDLGPFKDFFMRLGTTNSISMTQYADVLRRIHSDVKDQKLNPDQRLKTKKALDGFLNLLETAETSRLNSDLFIPCTDCKLHRSSEVVFSDNSWLNRIPNFNLPVFDVNQFGYDRDVSVAIFKKT